MGERALRDDPAFFADLRQQLKSWTEAYALDVLARQIRPKAEAAFREHSIGRRLSYERVSARLTPAEFKKLDIARQRSGSM